MFNARPAGGDKDADDELDSDLEGFGLVLEDDGDDVEEEEEPVFYVWPENVQAVELFCVLANQWRVVAGFTQMRFLGLDYVAMEAVMRMRGVKRSDQARLLAELRVMEDAAARELNRKRGG